MNRLLLILILFAAYICSASPPALQGKVLAYGIITVPNEFKDIHILAKNHPSGYVHNYHLNLSVIDTTIVPIFNNITNRFPAKLGLTFGIQYEIDVGADAGDIIPITIVTRYPPITRPDGRTFVGDKGIRELIVKNGKVTAYAAFTFDYDYELVPGEWEFELRVNDQTVCDQIFNVVKE